MVALVSLGDMEESDSGRERSTCHHLIARSRRLRSDPIFMRCGPRPRPSRLRTMPMIDVFATAGTFRPNHQPAAALALARAVMRWEGVPDIPLFADNTAAFIHDLPEDAIANAAGASNYVRVQ